MKKTGIVFFDFDGTLIKTDSFGLFAKFAVGKRCYYTSILLTMPYILGWKLGLLSNSKAKQHLFSRLYKGRSRVWFEEKGEEFISLLDNYLRQDIMVQMAKYQEEGMEICIVTASLFSWVKPWAASHDIDFVLSTEAEYDTKGGLTGKFATPNCHGEEKVRRITTQFPNIKEVYSKIYAYGDSKGDLPMIRFAGNGTLV